MSHHHVHQINIEYNIEFKELQWSNKNVLNTSNCGPFNQTGKLLTNLIPGTTYEYRVVHGIAIQLVLQHGQQ